MLLVLSKSPTRAFPVNDPSWLFIQNNLLIFDTVIIFFLNRFLGVIEQRLTGVIVFVLIGSSVFLAKFLAVCYTKTCIFWWLYIRKKIILTFNFWRKFRCLCCTECFCTWVYRRWTAYSSCIGSRCRSCPKNINLIICFCARWKRSKFICLPWFSSFACSYCFLLKWAKKWASHFQ